MSASGILVGISSGQWATITATTTDGDGSVQVDVREELAGAPATLRLAHVVEGFGPITFRRNNAAPVTLAFGESVDLPIGSGTLLAYVEGLPSGHYGPAGNASYIAALVRGGDQLAIYAIGSAHQALVSQAWSRPAPIGPDSGLVRFVQGWNQGSILYLRAAGGAMAGLPELCYFGPSEVSPYYPWPSGDFDAIVERKFAAAGEFARVRGIAVAGRARTFVFVGDSARMHVLVFEDR